MLSEFNQEVLRAIEATSAASVPAPNAEVAEQVSQSILQGLVEAMDWDTTTRLSFFACTLVDGSIGYLVKEVTSGTTFLLKQVNSTAGTWRVPSVVWAPARKADGSFSVNALLCMPPASCAHFGVPFVEANSELPRPVLH